MTRTESRPLASLRSFLLPAAVRTLGLWAMTALSLLLPTAYAAGEPYRLGIVPFFTAVRLEEIYAPVAAELGKALARPVEFRTATGFDKYYDALKRGEYDIAVVHSFFYVPAVDEFRYQPLARMQEPFTAVIAVLENSPVKSLADLKGKTVATPPEYLPTVHLVRRLMRDRGFNPTTDFTFKAFKGVDSCLQQVAIGDAAGCICPPFALQGLEVKMNLRFRRVVESPAIPNLTFIVHNRVPEADRRKLRDLLLGLSSSDDGRRLLQPMQTKALVAAQNAEYDNVRQMLKQLDLPWLPSSP